MSFFIEVVLFVMGLEAMSKIWCMATDKMPVNTPVGYAIDTIAIVGLIIWGVVVLK